MRAVQSLCWSKLSRQHELFTITSLPQLAPVFSALCGKYRWKSLAFGSSVWAASSNQCLSSDHFLISVFSFSSTLGRFVHCPTPAMDPLSVLWAESQSATAARNSLRHEQYILLHTAWQRLSLECSAPVYLRKPGLHEANVR